MRRSLYICYFSLQEPLVQTQVLPYLREITKSGVEIHLLTFEPNPSQWTQEKQKAEKSKLAENGIYWDFLKYHKRPSVPATAYDILIATFYIWLKNLRFKYDILHARVHVPMLMATLARKLSFHKPKIIFDIRGFFPEEYVDAGIWRKDSLLYKVTKAVERWLMKEADGFVVLTERAREILFPESAKSGFDKEGRPVEVIPCCVDFKRFDSSNGKNMRQELGLSDRLVAVYVGALDGWYMTEETADFFGILKQEKPNAFALILTQSNSERMEKLLKDRGFNEKDFLVTKVSPSEIPAYLNAADFAVSFIKPCYSKQSSSPTKNAEYLICGLPIVANDGIGDTSKFLREDKTGVIIEDFSLESYRKALKNMEELIANKSEVAARCRQSAKNRFDLEKIGGERYRRLYNNLLTAEKPTKA